MKPLLAHVYEPHRVTYPCYVQPKLNGIRALYQAGHFQSRDELPFPVGLLDHLARPLRNVFGPEVILDGELYVHGWPLQRILSAVTPIRGRPTEDTGKVEYHVFDVVDFGKNFHDRVRAGINIELLRKCRVSVFPVHTIHCGTEALANELYAKFVSGGYEGMMYRLGDCLYTQPKQEITLGERQMIRTGLLAGNPRTRFWSDQDNRVWHMLKRKDWHDDEFPFINLRETTGEKGNRGFIMTLRLPSGAYFDVSSGLSDAELDHLLSNPPTNRLVKVQYLVLSSAGVPLNATILAVLP